jgi:hypothetical protein
MKLWEIIKMLTLEMIVDSGICDDIACDGAGDFLKYAKKQGYPYCAVLDWSSSAGNWSFVVSMEGDYWQVMYQENNFPRRGFTRTIDDECFAGTQDEALEYFTDRFS